MRYISHDLHVNNKSAKERCKADGFFPSKTQQEHFLSVLMTRIWMANNQLLLCICGTTEVVQWWVSIPVKRHPLQSAGLGPKLEGWACTS